MTECIMVKNSIGGGGGATPCMSSLHKSALWETDNTA